MPCSFIEATWSGLSRRARMPPWTFGWSVFTRPSIISGKPVKSATSVTTTPFSLSSCAVPPVERISMPSGSSALASSTTPVLSETLMRALWTLMPLIQAVLLELLAQGVAVHPEQFRGARLVAMRLEHHDLEHRLLHGEHHHVVDAGRLFPVEVLEVLSHHLAYRERQLVLPVAFRLALVFFSMLQAPPLQVRIRVAPSARAARRRMPPPRQAASRHC